MTVLDDSQPPSIVVLGQRLLGWYAGGWHCDSFKKNQEQTSNSPTLNIRDGDDFHSSLFLEGKKPLPPGQFNALLSRQLDSLVKKDGIYHHSRKPHRNIKARHPNKQQNTEESR